MPWPDVKGKRCLDVWTFDASLRFEMAGYRVTNLAGDRLLRCMALRADRYVLAAPAAAR